VADASGTRTKAKSGRRIWRRVGWGALIVLAVLVIAAAIALWLGPPRDPKSFALDDEDFGLGFRVGDPWDPDAFEAAMKANGLRVTRERSFSNASLLSTIWDGDLSFLTIQALASPREDEVYVDNIIVSVFIPYDWDEKRALIPNHGIAAGVAGVLYSEIAAGTDIKLGTDENALMGAYGRPLTRLQFDAETKGAYLLYAGDHQLISFGFSDGHLDTIDVMTPSRDSIYLNHLSAWFIYISSPVIERLEKRKLENLPSFNYDNG
jgi:hypothetical protein